MDEFKQHAQDLAQFIKEGAIFIYPTDTIYGIGCNAEDEHAVGVLRSIKFRYKRPFSVIAPSKEWIKNNCEVPEKGEEWLAKLPGAYTLILKLKNKKCIAPSVTQEVDTLGVRIPDHWIKCKGCTDMVDEEVACLYVYGYCVDCVMKIPDYIEQIQWGRWLDEYYKTKIA